jgi:enoyl-CoA hydratase
MRKHLKSTDCITFEVKDSIARITLNRPDKRNAISPQLSREVGEALVEADDLKDVNVIVLAGAGKDFCAGYDLGAAYGGKADITEGIDHTQYRTLNATFDDDCWQVEQSTKAYLTLFDIHKPVIGKIHGNCLAGGTDLALMCDILVAAEDARIGFPAARANGQPAANMWLYHLGPQWAKRMLMTGDSLTGADAARLGLVLDAFPADRLDAEVNELARRMACIDSELLAAHKRVINTALELGGARTVQRMAAEIDARAHLSQGPRRTQFKKDMASGGIKVAVTNRDAPFGDGYVKPNWAGR